MNHSSTPQRSPLALLSPEHRSLIDARVGAAFGHTPALPDHAQLTFPKASSGGGRADSLLLASPHRRSVAVAAAVADASAAAVVEAWPRYGADERLRVHALLVEQLRAWVRGEHDDGELAAFVPAAADLLARAEEGEGGGAASDAAGAVGPRHMAPGMVPAAQSHLRSLRAVEALQQGFVFCTEFACGDDDAMAPAVTAWGSARALSAVEVALGAPALLASVASPDAWQTAERYALAAALRPAMAQVFCEFATAQPELLRLGPTQLPRAAGRGEAN